jgi:hypothetical protein
MGHALEPLWRTSLGLSRSTNKQRHTASQLAVSCLQDPSQKQLICKASSCAVCCVLCALRRRVHLCL